MEVMMVRTLGGGLVPMDDGQAEKMRRWKPGSVVAGDFKVMRNGAYFRKWWALAKLAFEMWSDDLPETTYRGEQVRPNFERFRKDLVILCGLFDSVFAADGTVRLEAKSISFAKMTEDQFEELYSQTINVVLTKVLKGTRMTDAELRAAVDAVMRFD